MTTEERLAEALATFLASLRGTLATDVGAVTINGDGTITLTRTGEVYAVTISVHHTRL